MALLDSFTITNNSICCVIRCSAKKFIVVAEIQVLLLLKLQQQLQSRAVQGLQFCHTRCSAIDAGSSHQPNARFHETQRNRHPAGLEHVRCDIGSSREGLSVASGPRAHFSSSSSD
jgi:hypothetical protein